MIYELFYPLKFHYGWLSWLNVLRYIPFRTIMATITAMVLTFVLAPWFIRELRRKQIGQVVRAEGPETHKIKAGTPTMGGALILLSLLLPTVLWADLRNPFVLATTAVTAGYGVIGYLDDFLKIKRRNSGGLPGRYKLIGQVLIGGAAVAYTFLLASKLPPDWAEIRTRLAIPFVAFSKYPIELPLYVYIPFAVFVVVATSNAVNLTDGLDGLAIGPVIINAGTYLILAYIVGASIASFSLATYLDIPAIASAGELSVYCGSVIGAGIGFLWYNTYPAQVFMGDVGSLALGGGLGMLAVFTKNELLSIILGGIFFIETVSVITQVLSFKLTGKRVFLMAPIHHHYEKKGWAEPKIIVRFWIISILLALVSLASMKLR
ncbi:phospho-N-acetylmuramoyl-pentapeptide-transferase [Sorangium sp. So ce448]|uniref:Phospho-N-acetylmuramoyl-pentapeptide-transferase n=2 Tax=Sorangium TaxID=39643 RepID=MRAY_SORC5|nr:MULTISPECIES: phospho-N-acetylmuramoyl-pentapeptide-transferase [Sorangium]A9FI43.1 RecName: Full=Phospho-N-acetylmuramoyl-pentapeptide-transferase; AltName: Full=UDP-MurNAc-pentapeptide phosphotransferase [Sorangium cellulosum So ce56]MDC0683203.1 phospho-N-acetylmuramoyl-pentapeptide-transferase [Sorangium aterium]CAN91819.1 phospho-N-acetylmuramoyl-pentapeptide transferase [Sorangium cellulosum So ce56]